MSEVTLFDLDKIKDLMAPIEIIQENINKLNVLESNLNESKNLMEISLKNQEVSKKINELISVIKEIIKSFEFIFHSNINIFLNLHDNLIEKYKARIKTTIDSAKINSRNLKKIGLYLIDKKKISKIPQKINSVNSIGINEWIELVDVMKENSIFQKIIIRFIPYYEEILNQRLNNELQTMPPNVDNNLILKFKERFLENPDITFKEFLREFEDGEQRSDLIKKELLIKRRKERENLEELKKKQEERKDEYQDYLTLSEKEFERRIRKKKREKLSDIASKENLQGELVISNEVSEKIEKFKSQFEENFKEKYLTKEESNKDPIDLIRERRKRKKEEYDEYKDHFNNI